MTALTMDKLIDWLRQQRESYPQRDLSVLLANAFCGSEQSPCDRLPTEQLLDLACIDLIRRRRAGSQILAEDFLRQFDCLNDAETKLDLIDAELCVRRETEAGREPKKEIEEYQNRFPEMRDQILELIALDPGEPVRPVALSIQSPPNTTDDAMPRENADVLQPDSSHPGVEVDSSLELSFGATMMPSVHMTDKRSPPIEVPEWFIGEHCVANSPGRWLIRGRDVSSGQTLVMKVVSLPTQLSANEADQILDDCERAVRVHNTHWVAPSVAAIQQRNLAVIRPWIYGTVWQSLCDAGQVPARLRALAKIAFSLQAAHRLGASHGGVHANNIVIDHSGAPYLVDSISSGVCIERWFQHRTSESNVAWQKDAHDIVKLVILDHVDAPGDWGHVLQQKLHQILRQSIDANQADACGAIGDELMRSAEKSWTVRSRPSRINLRRRLALWLGR